MSGVSDAAQGPGWWQASDGRWYPPEAASPPPPPAFPGSEHDVLPAGAPGAYLPGPPQRTAGKATATLILAIVSFVACPILPAIAALIVGAKADREIRDSYGSLGGEGLVKAGRILAIVHLCLSVVMIPLMAAIAIPTFLGAQERAQDRSVQSELRNALAAEKVFYTDELAWTVDPAQLSVIEPSLTYEPGATPLREGVVYVIVEEDIVGLGARSRSGTCFYVTAAGFDSSIAYATDESCRSIEQQQFLSAWE